MAKTIWGGALIAFFGLFTAGLSVQSDATWKTPLLILTGFGSVVCAIGWLCTFRKEHNAAPARGDLYLTARRFDYDEQGEFLWAKLAFYNGDSITRTLIDVKFTYRPNADTEYILFDTEIISSGRPAGVPQEIEFLTNRWDTIEYRSIAPKASNAWFKNIGTQAGLYLVFTNALRQEDHAKVMGMEVTKAMVSTPAYLFPGIQNLSLDSISDSKQIDMLTGKVTPRPPRGFAKYFGKFGLSVLITAFIAGTAYFAWNKFHAFPPVVDPASKPGQTLETPRPPPTPPITVTNVSVHEPYEIGKHLRTEIVAKNTVPNLKIRSFHIVVIAETDELDLPAEKRRVFEKMLWKEYETSAQSAAPEWLTAIVGEIVTPVNALVLTEEAISKLKSEKGVVYVIGQIDYGTGTLDYCSFIQPAQNSTGWLCTEHNGPVSHPAFK